MSEDSKARLERMRAKHLQEEEAKTNSKKPKSDIVYKHWDIPVDSEAVIRLLPDGDSSNDDFWVTKLTINLPFAGQIGGEYATDNDVSVTVPCVEMWKMSCPIIAATKPLWKGSEDEVALARQYYKKKSYLFQGFVVKSPFEEQNVPENPIRRFVISSSIFEIIFKGVMNPEFENFPADYVNGRDFKIAKTTKGGYPNYSTSSWAFRERALTTNELVAIDQYNLTNLSTLLGEKPDADGVEMIKQMYLDSRAGKPFDYDSYGHLYRAYGSKNDSVIANVGVGDHVNDAPVVRVVSRGDEEATPVATKPQAADILERIRQRTAGNRT